METLLILAALLLAFSNGANDNFKGFATVWGSDTLGYRRALGIATVATLAGSLVSLMLAESLALQFTGKGLVPDALAGTPHFILSVGLGAAQPAFDDVDAREQGAEQEDRTRGLFRDAGSETALS